MTALSVLSMENELVKSMLDFNTKVTQYFTRLKIRWAQFFNYETMTDTGREMHSCIMYKVITFLNAQTFFHFFTGVLLNIVLPFFQTFLAQYKHTYTQIRKSLCYKISVKMSAKRKLLQPPFGRL
jgi:hypothetical protein